MVLDNPYGPYAPDDGGKLEFTLFVKAAPERSAKYGETVCTAGVLDDGRLVRIYPVTWDTYRFGTFPKWKRVRAELVPSDERANRPESHKLKSNLIPITSPLERQGNETPWEQRMDLLAPAIEERGIQGLRDAQEQHRTSLGVVKVRELIDFRITAPLDEIVEQANYRESGQVTLEGDQIMEGSRVDKLKHVFRYSWRCHGPCCDQDSEGQGYHDTTCEDWELFQAFRKWRDLYEDDEEFLAALGQKFYDAMGQSDLHFAVGTPSNPAWQNSWMIVGLIYPGIPGKPDPRKLGLCSQKLEPSDILDVDAGFDDIPERAGRRSLEEAKRAGPLDDFFEVT